MEAKLVVLAPAEIVNTEFNLQLPVTIGRGRDAKIKLVHGQISRLHCEVYEENGELKARDLGSLNGTFVDGERVSDAALKPGGMLNIGSVTFRAVYGTMPVESDDSVVEFGAPRITDTVSTTSTVMEGAFPDFGTAAEEPVAAADDDDLGMFDFADEPAPAKAVAPAPAAPPAPAPAPAPAVEAEEELGMFDFADEPASAEAGMPEPLEAAADDDLGMFDFTEAPAPAKAAAPAPIAKPAAPPAPAPVAPPAPPAASYDSATISMPTPAKAAPAKAPAAPAAPAFVPPAIPAAPAKEANVDDWLSLAESTEEAAPATDDDDLQSFFGNMK